MDVSILILTSSHLLTESLHKSINDINILDFKPKIIEYFRVYDLVIFLDSNNNSKIIKNSKESFLNPIIKKLR